MAQEFITSYGMLSSGGRESAQRIVLVTLDGKYSCKYQVDEEGRELTDKRAHISLALLVEFQGGELTILKRWTSHQ